jgi:hypothetical protein
MLLLVNLASARVRDPFSRPSPEPLPPRLTADCILLGTPRLEVPGTVLSPTGHRAILRGPKRQYLVAVGDRLGDYRVVGITRGQVVLGRRDQRFRMP